MTPQPTAEPYVPATRSLSVLRDAVQECHGCDLYKHATQAVFGEGPRTAKLMMVGEVPGDREDKLGHVFVGPAGHLLDEALAAAKLSRANIYMTNVVKHFKYTQRGKRRIHDKPSRYEVKACRPWLDRELALVKPDVLMLLGAFAAQALLGNQFRVTQSRGVPLEQVTIARVTIATVHPASVLRAPDPESRRAAREQFFADIAKGAAAL